MRMDTQELVKAIEQCVDLALDGRLSKSQRKKMGLLAKRLRGSLINLLTADFAANSQEVKDAEKKLTEVNKKLSETKEDVDKAANTVKAINKVIGQLDKLLGFAIGFI